MTNEVQLIQGVERLLVSREQWQQQRALLVEKEKAHTRAGDALAAERRRLPWLRVSGDYSFENSLGVVSLKALFAGRRQLIVYHHMLQENDDAPCPGCGIVGDQMPKLVHLYQRDTSLAFVSRAPVKDIEAFKSRMQWTMPWFSTRDGFNGDFGITDGFGVNVFYRDDDSVYRTYFTSGRSVEQFGTIWALLDLTPLGRQEQWETSPTGTPQTPAYRWWRLSDEYD